MTLEKWQCEHWEDLTDDYPNKKKEGETFEQFCKRVFESRGISDEI